MTEADSHMRSTSLTNPSRREPLDPRPLHGDSALMHGPPLHRAGHPAVSSLPLFRPLVSPPSAIHPHSSKCAAVALSLHNGTARARCGACLHHAFAAARLGAVVDTRIARQSEGTPRTACMANNKISGIMNRTSGPYRTSPFAQNNII